MNARVSILVFGFGLLAGGCVVPTLEQLEAQQPLACNAEGRCVPGYSCVKGLCIPGEGRVCLEGDERACGAAVGECSGGTEVCGSDGRFGTCDMTKVKYGPAYELQETLCDGKDNDCDGATDEDLSRTCPLTEGVCATAVSLCVQGAWQECTPGTYLAASSLWQAKETTCDGQDNDCDGAVDGAREPLVPASVAPRIAAAVPLGDGGEPDVMLAWEQGNRILFRRVNADGGLGPPRYPASRVEISLESWNPTFAQCECNDCGCHLATWFERYACGSTGSCSRLVGGTLHPDGWTRIGSDGGSPDAGVVMPLYGLDDEGRGGELQVVKGGSRVAGVFTVTGAGGTTVRLISCPAALDDNCLQASLGSGDMPTVALSADGGLAAAAWRRDGGLVIAGFALATMNWSAPPSSWPVVDVAGSSGETEPRLVGDPSGNLRLYSVGAPPPDGGAPALVFRGPGLPCNGNCPEALTASSVRVERINPATDAGHPSALTAGQGAGGGTDLLAFQVGSGPGAEGWLVSHSDAGWTQPTRLPGPAVRPLWVSPDVLFLESDGAVARDLVCHP
ncbi:MAG: hypothetical protein RL653_472 [Pseudomonadota bacterium]|jgi:hypothetical protein